MLEHYFEPKTNNKKWIWIFLFVAIVGIILFWLCKKNRRKKQSEINSDYDLLAEEDCIACCENPNNSIHESAIER